MKISFASSDRINMQNNALIWKYVFQYKSGAFKDLRIFLMETLGKMFEFTLIK